MRRLVNLNTGEVREVSNEEYQATCDEIGRGYMPAPSGWCWFSQMTGNDWLFIAERLRKGIAELEAALAKFAPTIQNATQSIFDYTKQDASIAMENDDQAE